MSNRAAALKQEVAFSESLEEKPAAKVERRDGDWRSDLDEELSRFFAGDYVGDAGLRSGFGYQLERARDGVSFSGPGFAEPRLPRGIEVGPSARGLDVGRVLAAFERMHVLALPSQLRQPTPAEMHEANETAGRQIGVLSAYYRKHPVGAYVGLIGLEPYAMLGPLTAPIVKVGKAWIREELEKELAHAASAAVLSKAEAEKRVVDWRKEREDLVAKHGEQPEEGSPPAKRLEWLDATLRAATAMPQRIDVSAIIRAKWNREPTYDELRAQFRFANENSKRLKVPELRDAAKRLVAEAMAAAKRDLGAARQAYALARTAGRKEKRDAAEGRRKTKRDTIIEEYDERHGIR